ncbi:interferon alpha-inducible protein 27-like protein 2 [Tachysurus ichikawai]
MKKVLKTVIGVTAGVAAGTVGTVVLAPAVLGLVGFTAGGIAAGSIAAGMMSSAAIANGGGIAAGSLVAVLQSVGAAGFTAATTAGVASTGGVIGGVLGWFSDRKRKGQCLNPPESVKLSVLETGNSSAPEDDEEDEDASNGPSSKELKKI